MNLNLKKRSRAQPLSLRYGVLKGAGHSRKVPRSFIVIARLFATKKPNKTVDKFLNREYNINR